MQKAGFLGDSVVENLPAPNAGGFGSIPGEGTGSHILQLRPSAAK